MPSYSRFDCTIIYYGGHRPFSRENFPFTELGTPQKKKKKTQKKRSLTSLGGGAVGAVLGPVAGDHLVVAGISAQRERDLDDVVAGLHQHQDSLDLLALLLDRRLALHVLDHLLLADLAGPVEEQLDHVEEARVGGRGHILQPVRNLVLGGVAALGLGLATGAGGSGRRNGLDQRGHLLLEGRTLRDRLQVEHFEGDLCRGARCEKKGSRSTKTKLWS